MKSFLFLAVALLPSLAQAAVVQCSTNMKDGESSKRALVNIHFEEGYLETRGLSVNEDGSIEYEDAVRQEILASETVIITGAAEYSNAFDKCGGLEGSQKCGSAAAEAFIPNEGLSRLEMMARLGVLFMKLHQVAPPEERPVNIDLDLTKIAGVRAYQLGESSKWGTPGLFEYLDSSGALLGRFLIATPFVIPCK